MTFFQDVRASSPQTSQMSKNHETVMALLYCVL